MNKHIHTKSANANKIAAALDAVAVLSSTRRTPGTTKELLAVRIKDVAALCREAELALQELKDQTFII